MFEKKRLQFSPGNNDHLEDNNEYTRYSKQELKQELDNVQQLTQKHMLDQYTPQQKDQLILNLASKIDIMANEIFNLSNIADTLMYEQKLAKEKYETLKSRFNTIAMTQQKEDIINNNPYKFQETGQNAMRYNQYSKKEMYQLLKNADNKSLTSPRRVIQSIGILYKDKLLSQQMLRDRINELENEVAALHLENNDLKQSIETNNLMTFGNKPTENEEKEDSQQEGSGKKAFSDYHSIDTMVQRYQGM
ncbi:hypothetical protein TTHERM_00242250 (macronuclear) [Tetrahymena thermophila SB210]|uniref:Uncharacterized protein n=1 Tax=Tetrahymena thermophila (strain SB210) TaxID=312017 RepID=I7MME6_TETTS|nr:hypothetical protein TTHERM_00242250 [Tetrahymena thermophila SB210]EAS04703.2 hypothetical protein TTHERM_00242250 [Tetrahymena thermophila SB210]|eukprot:XP_001024948.2 hypothetical protein TTHERM_00242250 [Tetrahymena thermophila SB210]